MRAYPFNLWRGLASRIRPLTVAVLSAIVVFTDCGANAAPSASELNQTAAQLSDTAFAMLNGLNGTTASGQANPMLGAVAGFAANAQALSKALASSDHKGASAALGSLQKARSQIDDLIASNAGALPSAEWSAAKSKLDLIAASIPSTPGLPVAAAASAGGSAAITPKHESSGPRIEIESAKPDSDGTTHLRGYLRGSALTAAGIYAGERELKAFDVGHVVGAQRLSFDIAIEQLLPDLTVRAADADGRQAVAPVSATPAVKTIAPMAPSEPREAPIGSEETRGGSADLTEENGAEVASVAPETTEPSSGSSTEEIPPLGMSSPSAAHLHGHSSSSGNGLHIEITQVRVLNPQHQAYEVAGRLAGVGIKRAGIYVDGTLAASIPLGAASGAGTFDFDQTFSMGGNVATIRVYAKSGRYLERAIPIATSSAETSSPMPMAGSNPNQIAIQIATLQPISAQVYLVTGTISGRNLASAGLYQNGAMVQQFATAAGLLSSVAPQVFRQVNFSAQFNRAAGPAVVRVVDSSGHEIDQPLTLAGAGYGAPYGFGGSAALPVYGRTNPEAYNPNVSGFGSRPYGSSYGANPYGTNPFSTQPPPAGTKWWQQLLR